jgi:hypothetical protein
MVRIFVHDIHGHCYGIHMGRARPNRCIDIQPLRWVLQMTDNNEITRDYRGVRLDRNGFNEEEEHIVESVKYVMRYSIKNGVFAYNDYMERSFLRSLEEVIKFHLK